MQSTIARINDHIWRLRRQLGAPIRLDSRRYRLRGYISNNFSADIDHEPHLKAALRRALAERSGPFVDVGVNVGQTLIKVLAIDPDRAYLGFEPQIAACFFVNRFLSDNNLSQMRVLPVGLSDTNGLAPIYARAEADSTASLVPDDCDDDARAPTFIQVRRGDEVLAEAGCADPAIIKIDVEGAEMLVLRGLANTIRSARPIVFFEMLPNFHGDGTLMPAEKRQRRNKVAEEQFAFLAGNGYEIRQLAPNGEERKIGRFALDDAEAFVSSDYVAHPAASP